VLRRDPRAVTTAAPLDAVLSATIVDAAFARARSGTCRLLGTPWRNHHPHVARPADRRGHALQHAADDGPVAGSSPLGPPRSPTLTEISRGLTNTRGFAGRRAGLQSLQGKAKTLILQ
jgi:hypothetical protein